jgi:hypothetical protein
MQLPPATYKSPDHHGAFFFDKLQRLRPGFSREPKQHSGALDEEHAQI